LQRGLEEAATRERFDQELTVHGLRARCRSACQTLVAAVGAEGPCNVDDAARRAVARIDNLESKLLRIRGIVEEPALTHLIADSVDHEHATDNLARAVLAVLEGKTTICVRDWTEAPGGRYRKQGPFSGEAFREEVLLPALKNGPVEVDLGWVAGYGTGWLEEVFGGAVRADLGNADRISVESSDPDDDYFVRLGIKFMGAERLRAQGGGK
jgi:hypothetical protein